MCLKISVIVPVFNAEKYLRKTIDSILNQSFTDFELILVNDGSTDSSKKICEEYALKDKRIILLNQENQGVSVARNNGLKIAKGDYISFIDSDDWIIKNFFEDLYGEVIKSAVPPDIIFCNRIISNGKKSWFLPFNEKKEFKEETLKEYLMNILLGKYESFVTNKLYNKKLIEQYKLFFLDSSFMEDNIFHIEAVMCSKLIIFIPAALYVYRNVFDRLTNKFDEKRCVSLLKNYQVKKAINKKYLSVDELEEFECYFMKDVLEIYLYNLHEIKKTNYDDFLNRYKLHDNFSRCKKCSTPKYNWCKYIRHIYSKKNYKLKKTMALKFLNNTFRKILRRLKWIS